LHITDIDLRLLRVFRAVVEADGFTNAQALLNVSQSTISNHMTQLEGRLGFKLCHRGRGGFSLTEAGAAFYGHLARFFQALHDLETHSLELRSGLAGNLRLAIIDNLITDPACPLRPALRNFFQLPDNAVHCAIDVLAPPDMERLLLAGELDAAVGIFCQSTPGLHYRTLYRERDVLVCNPSHPLAGISDAAALSHLIPRADKVIRAFMGTTEFPFLNARDESVMASVANVEAAAMLILSGPFIGFLPQHYARKWLDTGELIALQPERFLRYSEVSLVTRNMEAPQASALRAFLNSLLAVTSSGSESALASTG
jgi:LysR family transcriptional regulator, transcriptional activator for bauABCD operon